MELAGGDLGLASTRGGLFVLAGRFCGLASTRGGGLELAGGDLEVASTRGGGLVLAEVIGLAGASAEASESIFLLNLS